MIKDPLARFANTFTRDELVAEHDRLMGEVSELQRRAYRVRAMLKIFDELGADASPAEVEAAGSEGRPTLRNAILAVMREMEPNTVWNGDNLLIMLQRKGWEPGGKTPRNSVDAILSRLLKEGAIARVAPGLYTLPPETSGGIGAAAAAERLPLDEGV